MSDEVYQSSKRFFSHKLLPLALLGGIFTFAVVTFISVQRLASDQALILNSDASTRGNKQTIMQGDGQQISDLNNSRTSQSGDAGTLETQIVTGDALTTIQDVTTNDSCDFSVSCTTDFDILSNGRNSCGQSEKYYHENVRAYCNGEGFDISIRHNEVGESSCAIDLKDRMGDERECANRNLNLRFMCCGGFEKDANGCEHTKIDPRELRGSLYEEMQAFAARCWWKHKTQPTYDYVDADGDGQPELFGRCCPK